MLFEDNKFNSLLIHVSVSKKDRITDGFLIRREAVENNIPCLTSLDTARAVYKVLESMSFAIDASI